MSDVPTLGQATRVYLRIGLLSFGGPAGQIALMQDELSDRRRWIEPEALQRGLSVAMLLPGPEAQQLATWLGWRLHGVRGGLAAGLAFVLPGYHAWVLEASRGASSGRTFNNGRRCHLSIIAVTHPCPSMPVAEP